MADIPSLVALILGLSLGVWLLRTHFKTYLKEHDIHQVGFLPFLTTWSFFDKRYDFIWGNFQKTGQNMFQFHVLQHRVVAVRGEEARDTFLNSKGLDFTEGNKILSGGAPYLKDIKVDADVIMTVFNKRLQQVMYKERINDMLPILFNDIHARSLKWGDTGRFDPFEELNDLVFQLTVRMASCRELADNFTEVSRLSTIYQTIEDSATPIALVLPWLPNRARKAKDKATRDLFMILSKYVELRRSPDAVPTSDAIDVLIAIGLNNVKIISFIMGVIFAGAINTGTFVCWTLLQLAGNPEWKQKVTNEVKALVASYTESSSEPLHTRMSAIPMSAWEDEMPMLDLVIRETLRLIKTGTMLRRNLGEDVLVLGQTINKGDFVVYNSADVHLDPTVYTDPLKFDPDRFSKEREEDKKTPFSFLGWGAGRHPCSGMRVAKLEMKVIIAFFLAGYDYELVDKSGKPPVSFPQPNRNDTRKIRPQGDTYYLQYRRISS